MWKAEDKDTLRKSYDHTQLLRGLFQYESITINGKEHQLLSEQDKFLFDETKPINIKNIPPQTIQFIKTLFETLIEEGFPCSKEDLDKNLESLFLHDMNEVNPQMREFLMLTSMGMGGLCTIERFKTFPRIRANPYQMIHHRIGDGRINFGVENATTCEIIASADEIRVIQNKKFIILLASVKPNEEAKPIATFTISWDAPLPKNETTPFKAIMKICEFAWEPNISEKEKNDFKAAFFDLPQL